MAVVDPRLPVVMAAISVEASTVGGREARQEQRSDEQQDLHGVPPLTGEQPRGNQEFVG